MPHDGTTLSPEVIALVDKLKTLGTTNASDHGEILAISQQISTALQNPFEKALELISTVLRFYYDIRSTLTVLRCRSCPARALQPIWTYSIV